MIAEERRDFAAAEQWYRKSLAIEEKHGNEHDAASTYHQLGMTRRGAAGLRGGRAVVSQVAGDQGEARQRARRGQHLSPTGEDCRGAAGLRERPSSGISKSLAIDEKHGNEHGAAITYHQLGRIAQEQRDFAAAEQWYRKSLAIEEKHGDRARRGQHLSPIGEDCPGAAGLRGGRAVVSQVAGDQGKARQ